jgi:phosphotransferase system HPr (HPr) family protein
LVRLLAEIDRLLEQYSGIQAFARIIEEVCGSQLVSHTDAISPDHSTARVTFTASREVQVDSVLVVDDFRDTAESMAKWLKRLGHEVHIARDGIEAIEIARRQKPRYVLLDLGLPRMDGYQVARSLRQELAERPVIIAITGYGQELNRRQASEAGCDHFFLKPVDLNAVLSLLSRSHNGSASSIHDSSAPETTPSSQPVARREVEITNALGLHLRAAHRFVSLAQEFQAKVTVLHDGREVNGKSILDLTTLAVECGFRVVVTAQGLDAEAAVDALAELTAQAFDER